MPRSATGERTAVDLPGESSGIVRPLRAWSALSKAYVSFGQEVSVTSLQLARAMAALEPGQGGEYGTAECRAGRRFDLHPETAAFPTEHPIVPPLGHGGVPSLVGRA